MDTRAYMGVFNLGTCVFFACSVIGKFLSGTETGWTFLTLALATAGFSLSGYALLKKPNPRALKPGDARREK